MIKLLTCPLLCSCVRMESRVEIPLSLPVSKASLLKSSFSSLLNSNCKSNSSLFEILSFSIFTDCLHATNFLCLPEFCKFFVQMLTFHITAKLQFVSKLLFLLTTFSLKHETSECLKSSNLRRVKKIVN